MSSQKPTGEFRPEESSVGWFVELQLAVDRGDFERAAESQRQLDRLGWRVNRKNARRTSRQAAPRAEVVPS